MSSILSTDMTLERLKKCFHLDWNTTNARSMSFLTASCRELNSLYVIVCGFSIEEMNKRTFG